MGSVANNPADLTFLLEAVSGKTRAAGLLAFGGRGRLTWPPLLGRAFRWFGCVNDRAPVMPAGSGTACRAPTWRTETQPSCETHYSAGGRSCRQRVSPITVAGPRGTFTRFPILSLPIQALRTGRAGASASRTAPLRSRLGSRAGAPHAYGGALGLRRPPWKVSVADSEGQGDASCAGPAAGGNERQNRAVTVRERSEMDPAVTSKASGSGNCFANPLGHVQSPLAGMCRRLGSRALGTCGDGSKARA